MKYLYIVDYWVPFPSSEYGGVINVIASSETECHDILRDSEEFPFDRGYDHKILEKVKTSMRFALGEEEESRIVDCFIT